MDIVHSSADRPSPHQLQQVASDCWWVYVQSRMTGEFSNNWLRVVYIGRSREDAADWIARHQR